jgi:predicted TIM-barrel fold metal-dependent hydrolase
MLTSRANEILISADSHVSEEGDFWVKNLPAAFRASAPEFASRRQLDAANRFEEKPGGWDPAERLKEMATDGVSAEVLYPTLGLRLFGLDDAALQEACFRIYNDWLIEYCQIAPERLVGIGCISTYNVDHAIEELERCKKAQLGGALIWQVPHPDLPLHSDHYNRFWDAAQALEMPISLHILTGFNYSKVGLGTVRGIESYRNSVNSKTFDAVSAMWELIFYGVLHRYPDLKFVIVENEIGWIPFFLQQWDYYVRRFRDSNPPPFDQEPSAYFRRQVYATFFEDSVGGHNLRRWGQDNCMWSNDYPHPNSTWPNSRSVIDRDLGHLSEDVRAKLVRENVARLYGMKIPQPV